MRHPHRLATTLLLGPALASTVALAQETQRVEITGSSIKRIDAEAALPVQVLNHDDIVRTGAVNVEQLMQTISAMVSSGANMASASSGATTGGISSLSLRGLTSLRTLVLVNGRRLAPYGIGFTNDSVSVDVNSIPLAAIDRVEVLKDGASSVYGSDAIAGVVNFILRKDFRGGELAVGGGVATRGDADTHKASLTWGQGDLDAEGYNLVLVASLQHEGGLFGRDRAFASHAYDVAHLNDTTSGNTFPANIAAVDGSFGSVNPTAGSGCVAPYSFVDPLWPATLCRFDVAPLVSLLPVADRVSLFGAASWRLTSELEAFIEASYNQNKQRTVVQPVPLSDQFNLPSNNPLYNLDPYRVPGGISTSTIVLKPSSPYYPTDFVTGLTGGATPDLLVRYRAAVSGNRDITDTAQAPRVTAGLRGTAAGWDFDAALLHSQSRVHERDNDGWPVLSRLLPLLNSGQVNPFGPNTPEIDAQIRAANFVGTAFSIDSGLTSLGGKAAHDLARVAGGPAALALGAEARRETYRFTPSQAISEGDIGGYGGNFAFVDRARSVNAVFGELNLPLLKTLEANLSLRLDQYQGVGRSATPKLSLRWQPQPALLVRGAIGRGFRAPSLADLFAPATTGVTTQGLSDPLRCPTTGDPVRDCGTQFPTLNGGNAVLIAEKARNANLGLVLEPVKGLSVAVDAFQINLRDTISGGISPAVILSDLDKYGSYVTRGAADPDFPNLPGPVISIDQRNLNTGESRLQGFDIDARWKLDAGELGRLTLQLSGSYFSRFDTQNPDGSFTGGVGQVNSTSGGVIPRWKTYQAVTWSRNPWEATLAMNWQQGYHDLPGTFENTAEPGWRPRRVGDYTTLDTHLAYTGWKDLTLALGVKNLLDQDPPYTNAGGQTSFQSGYDPQYADPRGRFVYLNATYAFH